MGTIKDRNSKDLKDAEEIKKRWQEYVEEMFFFFFLSFDDADNHNGMVTHLLSNCESKVQCCKKTILHSNLEC